MRILNEPFYDGYTYLHGQFHCTFEDLGQTRGWIVKITTRNRPPFLQTAPTQTRHEAYLLARHWVRALKSMSEGERGRIIESEELLVGSEFWLRPLSEMASTLSA